MKKIVRKKLGLQHETVRALTSEDIAGVVGGYGNSAAAVTCHSAAANVTCNHSAAATFCHSAAANVTCRLSANGAATCRVTL